MVSIDKLKEFIEYNPDDGSLTWIKRKANCVHIGDAVGYITSQGYREFEFDNRCLRANRVAVALMSGFWPIGEVDHINRIRHDDRWCNLRVVGDLVQSRNHSLSTRNKTGVNGVTFNKKLCKYQAYIRADYKLHHLGFFETLEEARAARYRGEQLHWGATR